MTAPSTIIFVHGWSFDAHLWDPIIQALHLSQEVIFIDPVKTNISKTDLRFLENAIVIGHSLGVLWLLKQSALYHYKGLVSIGGFDCFYRYTDLRVLQAMQLQLNREPLKLIKEFRAYSGYPLLPLDYQPNIPILKEGLEYLSTWDCQEERKVLSCPILALASEDDQVVPKAMTEAIWNANSLQWSPDGGHVLPLTKSQWCAASIRKFIDDHNLSATSE